MSLVYESEFCQLYCGDSREILPTLPRNVSLIVTDPPYGVSYASNKKIGGWQAIEGDESTKVGYEVLNLVTKVAQQGKHIYTFGPFPLAGVRGVGKTTELIWDKVTLGMGDLNAVWSSTFEPIHFGNLQTKTTDGGLTVRRRRGAVLRYPKISGMKSVRHPTEKPIPLLRELVESSSTPGDVVLDPFMGTGSTGIASVLLGRKFIGIEIDETYAATAVARCKQAEKHWKEGLKL